MKRRLTNKGFTLIESWVSMLLLAIILVGGIALYVNSQELMTLAMHNRIASQMANKEMEDLKNTPYANLVAGTTSSNIVVGSLNASTADGLGRWITVYDPVGPNNYKEVEVRIAWREANKTNDREINLTTYIAP